MYSDEFRQFQENLKTQDYGLVPQTWEVAYRTLSEPNTSAERAFSSDWSARFKVYETFYMTIPSDVAGWQLATVEAVDFVLKYVESAERDKRELAARLPWISSSLSRLTKSEKKKPVLLVRLKESEISQIKVCELSAAEIALPLTLVPHSALGGTWVMVDAKNLFRVDINYRSTAFYRAITFIEYTARMSNIDDRLRDEGLLLALDWIFASGSVDNPLYEIGCFLSQRSGAPSQSTARRLMRQVVA